MHKIASEMHPGQISWGARRGAAYNFARDKKTETLPVAETTNLWGGRFSGRTDERFAEFNRSFGFDRKLFEADVRASLAHCDGLQGAGVLSPGEAASIRAGLDTILKRASSDASYFDDPAAEDVHSFVEARLVELVGDAGRKLHTGRSRNDQVATDLRLWLRGEIDSVGGKARDAQA